MTHNIHVTISDPKIKQLFEITCKIYDKKQKDVIMELLKESYNKHEIERAKKRYKRL